MRTRSRSLALVTLVLVLVGTAPAGAAATAPPVDAVASALTGWQWPVTPPHIVRPFIAPAHAYGPGHRGIDLAAPVGSPVASPAAGVIAFVGKVAGRGVATIDHGSGLVTTFEPVTATLTRGTVIAAGDVVAEVDVGGHAAVGSVHFGVREDGEYINPMLLLGEVPRAVLLPCC